MVWLRQLLLPILVLLVLAGCSGRSTHKSKTLSLSLSSSEEGFQVIDYEISERRFQESQQQGLYQAQLIDKEGRILQRIGFEKIDISGTQNEYSDAEFYVAVPLVPELNKINIYKLDGSSGHFQLKDDDPLLEWTLPQAVKEM